MCHYHIRVQTGEMKKIQTDKIELFAKKYIVDIGIAAVFIFFALVLAERPKVNYRSIQNDKRSLPVVSRTVSVKQMQEKAATVSKDESENPDPSDFSADEFRIQGKDAEKLCEAIKSDRYKLGGINAAGNSIEWLNEVLQVADLYDKVTEEKPDLVLSGDIRKLKEQTEEKRHMPFKSLKDD